MLTPADCRNLVGTGLVVAFLHQNASGRFHKGIDGQARSLLRS